MNRKIKNSNEKRGFTIIELLTIMSIIVLLISLLVPALNKVNRYARGVKQMTQFHAIDVAMEMFSTENEGYPDSGQNGVGPNPSNINPYCGAMKLAEAMVGCDLLGYNPDSTFPSDHKDAATTPNLLYPKTTDVAADVYAANMQKRKGPYLQLENANAFQLASVYQKASVIQGSQLQQQAYSFVLCDVFSRVSNLGTTGKAKIGMPILYYRADTSKSNNDPNIATYTLNIYNYKDNVDLIDLGMPFLPGYAHPMAETGKATLTPGVLSDPGILYTEIQNKNMTSRPYRSDSYILMSAGYDGQYGTKDDIFNFGE